MQYVRSNCGTGSTSSPPNITKYALMSKCSSSNADKGIETCGTRWQYSVVNGRVYSSAM